MQVSECRYSIAHNNKVDSKVLQYFSNNKRHRSAARNAIVKVVNLTNQSEI